MCRGFPSLSSHEHTHLKRGQRKTIEVGRKWVPFLHKFKFSHNTAEATRNLSREFGTGSTGYKNSEHRMAFQNEICGQPDLSTEIE